MDGDTVACCNHLRKMVPASNVKLLTTGVALRTLGPDFRFETSLGYTGEICDSTLVGDLYIIGGGDPTTGSKSDCAEPLPPLFARWTKILASAGISVDGAETIDHYGVAYVHANDLIAAAGKTVTVDNSGLVIIASGAVEDGDVITTLYRALK